MNDHLDELRNEWAEYSQRVGKRLRLNTQLLREDWIERQRERMYKVGQFGRVATILWVTTMALLGLFMGTHANMPALFVTALILDLWVIAAGITQLRQQRALRTLNFGLPLVELQARIETLRIARIRSFNRAFLTGQILWWIPFVVVLFAGTFGVNLYESPRFRTFAAWNVAGGICFIPLAMWLSHRYAGKLSRSSVVRRIADSIAGRDIAAAREYLEKLHHFADDVD